ncbi:MAG: hypothetical protein LBQ77_02330 [Treponema sp.]|jgi:hypothetical protein|nr:hypothetical protein [Treponema sp.]
MNVYKPLRVVLCIYEMIRLVLVIQTVNSTATTSFEEPLVTYTVPNALFLLIAFFLLLRLNAFFPYIELYIAGKIIVIVSFFTWIIVSLYISSWSVFLFPFILFGGDLLSLVAAIALRAKIRRLNRPESP